MCSRIICQVLYLMFYMIFPQSKLLFLEGKNSRQFRNLKILENAIDDTRKEILTNDSSLLKKIISIARSKVICIDQSNDILSKIHLYGNTTVVQVWHAGGAFKKFGLDGIDNRKDINKEKIRVQRINRNIGYAIVSDKKMINLYAKAFGIRESQVLPLGLVRSDEYFETRDEYITGKKVILYAPTFRTQLNNTRICSSYDVIIELEKYFPEYQIWVKFHPGLDVNAMEKSKGVIDVSALNMTDIFRYVNVLITDYSSIIFDYSMFTGKIIFFTEDIDEYYKQRGLYFDPRKKFNGFTATNIDELIEVIKNSKNNTKKFRNEFMNSCDGHCTEKVSKFIISLMEK